MTVPMLADALGPRGRRRVVVASVVSALAVVAVAAAVVTRLSDRGQLDAAKWEPFTRESVLRFLLLGLRNTVTAALTAMVLAMAVGVVMAVGRLARNRLLGWLAGAYVEFFRAIPLILLVFFSFLGLPKLGLHLSAFKALVLALAVYNGAVLGEIFRAGILSLDRGQSDAAAAVGLTRGQAMREVIVPQAARRMVPAIVSQLVTLLKDTSLGSIITFDELVLRGRDTGTFYGATLQAFVVVAAMYIAVNLTLSRIAARLEVRQRRRLGAGRIDVSGIEDLAVVAAQGTGAVGA